MFSLPESSALAKFMFGQLCIFRSIQMEFTTSEMRSASIVTLNVVSTNALGLRRIRFDGNHVH